VGKLEGKRHLGRTRCGLQNDNKMDRRKIACGGMCCTVYRNESEEEGMGS
jgi:hypothetical protein